MALPLRDDSPPRRFPVMTWALILACVVVFAFFQPPDFQTLRGARDTRPNTEFVYRWGAIPCEIRHVKPLDQHPPCQHEVGPAYPVHHKNVLLSLLSAMFLHGGIEHIAGNLLFLWVFGRAVEGRLGPFGLMALYLIGGVVATLTFVAANPGSTGPSLGASGAIAAVMGAYLVLRPAGRILTFLQTASLQVIYLPAWVVLGLFFVEQFFFDAHGEHQIAWQAHVGGMVFGALVAVILRFTVPRLHWRRGESRAGPDLIGPAAASASATAARPT